MSTLPRYLLDQVRSDLKEKMVFIGGPRQVGKTTFAQSFIKSFKAGHPGYLNWDNLEDRRRIKDGSWSALQSLVILDELHKFSKWRSLIKGHYDKLKSLHQFIVTGSARLDYYRKSGDSLLGRYYYYRLHPLSLNEINFRDYKILLEYGGFPEAFLKRNIRHLKRWHLQRFDRILTQDIRDLENVKDLSLLGLLAESLQDRVGSPLSRKNLAEDLEIDFKTVERWLCILENVYYCYRITPFGAPKIKAVKKEQKIYLWDWSEHNDPGKRWENFVASHLLKFCHYHEDVNGDKMELRFIRDISGKEIDFVVIKNKKPLFAVECKLSNDTNPSKNLEYFSKRLEIPIFYQVYLDGPSKNVSMIIRMRCFKDFAKEVQLV